MLYPYTVLVLDVFPLVRRRENGVAIPSDRLRQVKPLRADIHIGDHHSEPLGRESTQAWVFNPTPGPDIIPRLHDAKVNGMAQLGMNHQRHRRDRRRALRTVVVVQVGEELSRAWR